MAATSTARKQASKQATEALTCPECGRTFTRPAALGAHRKLTHGVAGSSKAGSSKNASGKRTKATAPRKRRTTIAASRTATAAATNGGAQSVDRDALLRNLFPNGIPPRQDLITQVNAWLDEAERLARSD
jgi:hypothetical protein